MSDVTVKTRIVLRNDTKTVLEASPLVLFKGEVALELNDEKKTAKFKVGDGSTTYAQLPYSTLTPDEIQGTYIKSLSVSGKSITYAKGDGTTGTITTQDTTYSVATISKEGLMSAADKVKLDGITESADSVSVTQTLKSGTEVGKVTVNGTATTLYAPTNTNTTYTLTQDSTDGHKITLTPSSGTATTITIPDNNTTYIQGTGITISNNQISNSGVRSITTGSSNGTISVNTNGTSENVAVKGLGSAAYTESTDYATASHTHSVMGAASSSAAGATGLVPAPAAGKQASFLRGDGTWVVPTNTNTTYTLTQDSTDGHKITLTPSGGTATTITIPDNNTTYNAGTGISLSGTTFSNSGVRSITTGSSNGTISVNTNGTSANVAVKGLGTAAYTASTDYATSGHTHSDATINSAGLMSATDKAKLDGISENAKTGTVTSVATGTGLTGGTITGSGTIKAKLKSETALTNDATASGNTANRTYAVAVDKSGYLAVNVPWTAYSAATSSAAGLMSADDKKKLDTIDEAANKITVDSGLSSTSTNPVQNKVINTALGTKINTSLKGSANGVAELDANGKVPSSQLPSFVDDVIEGYYKDGKFYSDSGYATLITAESGKIYTNLTDNKIYRWSGSAYVVISDTIALGETSTTAYRGDRGKTAYDHSQITSGNPHGVTKSEIGLGNVENKSSATIRGELTKSNVTTALGYTPPTSDTNTTYTLTQDSTDGHKITLTPSSGSATTITIPDNNTTYSAGTGISLSGTTFSNSGVRSITTGSSNGTISVDTNGTSANVAVKGLGTAAYTASTDYATSGHTHSVMGAASSSAAGTAGLVPAPAAGKQASFLRGDGTWVVPTNTNTTYTLTQDSTDGHKITLTPSSGTATTITIPDNNTTYSSKTAASGGTDVSLVTTGEKYKWNSKTSNTGTVTKVTAGTGLTGGDITTTGTIALDTSGVAAGTKGATANVTGTEGTTIKVPKITVDAYGRVTALDEYTLTNKNTTYSTMGAASSSSAGTAGLVPAPAAGKQASFLRGDGTWVVPTNSNTTYTLTQDSTDGHKITLTPSSGSATTITIPDNNTTYSAGTGISLSGTTFKSKLKSETALTNDSTASGNTANRTYAVAVDKSGYLAVNIPWSNTTYSAGTGISLSGTTFSNSGVRSIATGSSNGTISVDTNGTSANVAVKGLGTAAYTASTDYATASHTHSSLVGTDITGQTVDLNTYNLSSGSPTIAYYNQKTVGGAVNITNAPVANLEFLLVVELIRYNSTTDYISKQTCYLKDNRVYTRICTNGTWGAWTQLVFTDTHYTTHLYAGSGTAANATTTNGNTKITLTDNTTVRNSVAIKGTGATTVTSDASGNITINSTDNNTTYSSKTAASGGTDVSLVTTGEKYTWNNKTSNTGTVTKVTAGTGLTGGDITTTGTIALATSGVTAGTKGATANVTGTEGTTIKVPKITVDAYGRVTALDEYTLTNKNTTYTSKDAVNLGTDVSLVTTGEKYTWNKKISTNAELGQGYGTCTNDESTIHKVVNIHQQYALNVGGIVVVKFTNGVPANATMNINESGEKNIFYKGAAITANIINAGDIATFIYDGTYYRLISFDRDTDTTYTQGTGITISNNQISNSGVRSITTGSSNGTISVNTDGTSTDVAVNGLGSAAYTESTDYATKDHSHDDYLPLAGGTVTGVISKEQGSVVYSATGVAGTKGYINIATIKITQNYVNAPIEIAFCRRNDNIITRLYITFNNVNSTDPNIASFKYVGTSNSAWLVKSTTSTWNLYIQKNEGYDEIDIIDFHIPQYDAKKLIWTWNNTQTSTLPTTEITQVSLGGNVLSSTKASQDSAGQQINTTYIKELSVSDKTITYTKGDNTTGTITTQDTTYSPGTGLALSGTTFRTTVPRVTKSANSLPGANTCIVEEYKNGDSYNLPSNHFYHIYTAEGNNTDYATQLALGMTTSDAYYRNYSSGTWGEWKLLTNTASTTTPKENGTANVGTEINYARGDHVHPLQTSVSGNAGTATKLATPRTISLGNDFQGTATFDGSSGVTISSTHYSITVGSGISNNYPYHRIAKVENLTNSYTDIDAILMIRSYYNNGGFGIIKISLRTNTTGTASVASARWIVRDKYSADDVSIGLYSVFGSTYADVFFKTGKNARTNVYQIAGDRKWSLLKSNEVSNTTASDKLGSIEVYATIESAGTEIHSQAYSDIITAVDSAIVANANNSTKSNTLNVNRVTKDANVEPAINSSIMEEYNSGDYNLPTKNNVVYQILTSCGSNAKYATQLAISLSGSKAYIRGRVNGTWSSTWTDLTPGDATTTSSGLMSAADKNKLDLLNETGTFTVSLIGSNVGEILTTVGSYTRHGNMVHFHIYINEADPMVVNASAGYMTITGLPYSSIRYTVVDLIYNGYLLYPIDINDSQYAEDRTRYGMGAAVNGNSITFYLTVGQNNSLGSTVYWALDGSRKINMRISGTYSIS